MQFPSDRLAKERVSGKDAQLAAEKKTDRAGRVPGRVKHRNLDGSGDERLAVGQLSIGRPGTRELKPEQTALIDQHRVQGFVVRVKRDQSAGRLRDRAGGREVVEMGMREDEQARPGAKRIEPPEEQIRLVAGSR